MLYRAYWPLLLLLLPLFTLAQSSLYRDAQLVAEFLRAAPQPRLTFELVDDAEARVNTSLEWRTLSSATYRPQPNTFYLLAASQADTANRLRIELVDTTIIVQPFDTVYLRYNATSVHINHAGAETAKIYWNTPVFESDDVKRREVFKRLAFHSDFDKIKDPGYLFELERTLKTFRSNPFVPKAWYTNPHLDLAVLGDEIPTINANFQESSYQGLFYEAYPWQRLLNGDSVLQQQQTVSFEDLSSSYRQPIVTAQRALDVSSDRINQTSRERGLLDARTVAVGLSDFIAERAQEELNLTFFHRFKENLSEPSELTILFPNTRDLLQKFEISNYKTLLANARESFTADLKNLGVHFPEILTLPTYRKLNNDPNVYNLSLIYSIADMAYKDYSIENILLATHQLLAERQENLQKSIHQQLVDSLLSEQLLVGRSTPAPIIIDSAEHIQLLPAEVLTTIKTQTIEFIDLVQSVSNDLESYASDLHDLAAVERQNSEDMYERAGFELFDITYDFRERARQRFVETSNLYYNSDNYLELTGYQKGDNIEYQNRTLGEYYTDFDHYLNIIPAHLSGQEYYGYILEYPREEDHANYFQKEPLPAADYVTRGLNEARRFFKRGYAKKTKAYQELLAEDFAGWQTLAIDRLTLENQDQRQLDRVFDFEKRYRSLLLRLEHELELWKILTDLEEENFYIAGLSFFERYLEDAEQMSSDSSDEQEVAAGSATAVAREVAPLLTLCDYLRVAPEQYALFLQDLPEFRILRENFGGTLERAHAHLDFVEEGLDLQIQQLLRRFGSQQKTQLDLALADQRAKYWADLDYILYEETKLQSKADIAVELSSSAGETPTQSAYELAEELLNTRFKAEVDALAKEEAALDATSEENPAVAAPDALQSIASWYRESRVDTDYFATDEVVTQSAAEHSALVTFAPLQEELRGLDADVAHLARKEKELVQIYEQVAKHYFPDLVDAQANARNLAKSLELTTHLLLAFRDYEQAYEPLYELDSVRVEVTVSDTDQATGLTKMLRSDTLRVNKYLIAEPEIDQKASRWITREQFQALRSDPLHWNMFLALLYQRLTSLEDAPQLAPEGAILLATKFVEVTNDIAQNRLAIRRKRALDPDALGFRDYYPFIRSTVDLFNTMLASNAFVAAEQPTILQPFTAQGPTYQPLEKIKDISNEALSLYENIFVQNYSSAILNAMELLKVLTANQLDKKGRVKSSRAINAVLTYGTFMASLIDAETSEQVKNILQAVTLPPGSSRIKREVTSNFTINSYLGLTAGQDRLIDAPNDLESAALGAALSVPVGMTYSFSPSFIRNSSSFSFHLPLLDLGAITAFRQNPDQTNYSVDALPEFSWENLFSPGLFLVYNFANSPFSLGFGGQYGPQLREINVDNGEALFVNSWRFPQVFFNIDVPLFNLHTGARKVVVD